MNEILQILIRARDQASRTIGTVQRRVQGLTKAVRGATRAFGAMAIGVTLVVTALVKATKRGGQFVNVARAFTKQVGDQEKALNELREATQGLISDYQLMVQFNRAVSLGAARTTKDFARLSRTAIELGKALGVDAAFALESLATGIGRRSRLILDNLGIVVQGLESMSQSEVIETVLAAADQKLEEMGVSSLNAADGIQQLASAFTNLGDKVAAFLANSPKLQGALVGIAGLVNRVAGGFTSPANITPEQELSALRARAADVRQRLNAGSTDPSLPGLEAELARQIRQAQQRLAGTGSTVSAGAVRPSVGPVGAGRGLGGALGGGGGLGIRGSLAQRFTPQQRQQQALARSVAAANARFAEMAEAQRRYVQAQNEATATQEQLTEANKRFAAGIVGVIGAVVQGFTGGGIGGGLSALLGGAGAIVGGPIGAALGVGAGFIARLGQGGNDGPVPVHVASISDAAADKFTVIVTNQVVGARGPDDVRATNSRLTREKNLDGLDPFGEFAFG